MLATLRNLQPDAGLCIKMIFFVQSLKFSVITSLFYLVHHKIAPRSISLLPIVCYVVPFTIAYGLSLHFPIAALFTFQFLIAFECFIYSVAVNFIFEKGGKFLKKCVT